MGKFVCLQLYDNVSLITSQHFFGIIRQAAGENDHPTFVTFFQLYRMLSIYKLIKPPKFGNCSLIEDQMKPSITFNDFKTIFGEKKDNSMRMENINKLKERLDGLIITNDWECDEIIEQDYGMPEVVDCIVYYLTGYVCKRFSKSTICALCKDALIGSGSADEAQLTNLKTRGALFHPNMKIYNLLRITEVHFAKYCTSHEVYELTLSAVLEEMSNFTFPCEDHKEDMVANILFYYIYVRMRQHVKQESGEATKRSREKKKESRLHKN